MVKVLKSMDVRSFMGLVPAIQVCWVSCRIQDSNRKQNMESGLGINVDGKDATRTALLIPVGTPLGTCGKLVGRGDNDDGPTRISLAQDDADESCTTKIRI